MNREDALLVLLALDTVQLGQIAIHQDSTNHSKNIEHGRLISASFLKGVFMQGCRRIHHTVPYSYIVTEIGIRIRYADALCFRRVVHEQVTHFHAGDELVTTVL